MLKKVVTFSESFHRFLALPQGIADVLTSKSSHFVFLQLVNTFWMVFSNITFLFVEQFVYLIHFTVKEADILCAVLNVE